MRNQRGFTLVELITITAIVGILATIAITQFNAYRIRAYDADAVSVIRAASIAQEAYFVDENSYVPNVTTLETDYSLEVGNVIITDPMIVTNHSYHIEARHNLSPNVYEITGPGGIITKK